MGVPAVSYRATTNDDYDYGFYRLPNMLSHQCFNFEELQQTLKKILCGELGVGNGDERQTLIDHYLAAQKGPLACERIIDVLEKAAADLPNLPRPPIGDRVQGWFKATNAVYGDGSSCARQILPDHWRTSKTNIPKFPLTRFVPGLHAFSRSSAIVPGSM